MRRHDLWMFLLVVGGLILAGIGTGTGLKPLVAVGCLIAGVCAGIGMMRTHREGVIRTNWGTTRRAQDPIGFWIEASFWWTLILLWTLGGVAHGFGWLVR